MYKKLRRMLRKFIIRVLCKHSHPYYFFPEKVFWKHPNGDSVPVDSLKITVCWQCSKLLKIENYRA